jgi:uncharacterized small protein (DUF1192 family)
MDLDELLPKKTSGLAALQEDLSRFSIEDLDERIRALEAEIERCREMRASKQSTMAAAQTFFKR